MIYVYIVLYLIGAFIGSLIIIGKHKPSVGLVNSYVFGYICLGASVIADKMINLGWIN